MVTLSSTLLDHLSLALEGSGDDLAAILVVLQQDLAAAVPSFTGLAISIATGGVPVAITAIDGPAAARSSMLLPLHLIGDLPTPTFLVFYAAAPGAFADLAADTRITYRLDGQVEVDRHLPPPGLDSATAADVAAADRSMVNQAVGVLINRGYSPGQARREITARAAAANVPERQIAQAILGSLERPVAPAAPKSTARSTAADCGDEKGRR